MTQTGDKPQPPRKPPPAWVAWLLAFFGVNPGIKPWEKSRQDKTDNKADP